MKMNVVRLELIDNDLDFHYLLEMRSSKYKVRVITGKLGCFY